MNTTNGATPAPGVPDSFCGTGTNHQYFIQALTRIAEALELQNERLSDIRASVTGVNLAIQDAAGRL